MNKRNREPLAFENIELGCMLPTIRELNPIKTLGSCTVPLWATKDAMFSKCQLFKNLCRPCNLRALCTVTVWVGGVFSSTLNHKITEENFLSLRI